MDTRLVREGIAADDRLVHLHALTGQGREQLARAVDLLRLDGRGVGELIGSYAKGHHDFLERRVAVSLADTVDGALDLAHSGVDGRQRIGDRKAEIVMAGAPV